MEEFKRFVDWAGGYGEAAKKLGCSEILVRSICNGNRAVSKKTALKVAEVGGKRFSLLKLLSMEAA